MKEEADGDEVSSILADSSRDRHISVSLHPIFLSTV
jgi:hypothetical protein